MRIMMYSVSVLPNEEAHPVRILKTVRALCELPDVEVMAHFVSLAHRPQRILAGYGIEPTERISMKAIIPYPLFRMYGRSTHIGLERSWVYRWARVRMGRALIAAARQGPTIVYTRNEAMADILRPYAEQAGVPMFVELHHLKYVDRFRQFLAQYQAREGRRPTLTEAKSNLRQNKVREANCLRGTSGVLCLTKTLRRRLESMHLGVPLSWVPSGAELVPKRSSLVSDHGSSNDDTATIDVLYAGQFYPWKGVDTLVRAMARVPGARLTLVGGNKAADRARIERLISEFDLGHRVRTVGQVPHTEVGGFLARARVCVIPLPRRGYIEARLFSSPIKMFEYAERGKPIVASNLANLRESLVHGENAWLVEPDDAEALASGIRRLLDDTDLARRLGQGALSLAHRHDYAARAEAILEFCLAHRESARSG